MDVDPCDIFKDADESVYSFLIDDNLCDGARSAAAYLYALE